VDDTPQSRLRVSDADRDAVVAELGQHFQAGRLDPAELDDRAGHALRARVRGDLDALLADLPRAATPAPPASGRPGPRPAPPLVPVLLAAALLAAVVTAGALGWGWHHGWGAGVGWWPVWWLIPFLAVRMLWPGRRARGARSWR
jgi:hypothetical protein